MRLAGVLKIGYLILRLGQQEPSMIEKRCLRSCVDQLDFINNYIYLTLLTTTYIMNMSMIAISKRSVGRPLVGWWDALHRGMAATGCKKQ